MSWILVPVGTITIMSSSATPWSERLLRSAFDHLNSQWRQAEIFFAHWGNQRMNMPQFRFPEGVTLDPLNNAGFRFLEQRAATYGAAVSMFLLSGAFAANSNLLGRASIGGMICCIRPPSLPFPSDSEAVDPAARRVAAMVDQLTVQTIGRVMAHELGHCLGLPDQMDLGNLMHYSVEHSQTGTAQSTLHLRAPQIRVARSSRVVVCRSFFTPVPPGPGPDNAYPPSSRSLREPHCIPTLDVSDLIERSGPSSGEPTANHLPGATRRHRGAAGFLP